MRWVLPRSLLSLAFTPSGDAVGNPRIPRKFTSTWWLQSACSMHLLKKVSKCTCSINIVGTSSDHLQPLVQGCLREWNGFPTVSQTRSYQIQQSYLLEHLYTYFLRICFWHFFNFIILICRHKLQVLWWFRCWVLSIMIHRKNIMICGLIDICYIWLLLQTLPFTFWIYLKAFVCVNISWTSRASDLLYKQGFCM